MAMTMNIMKRMELGALIMVAACAVDTPPEQIPDEVDSSQPAKEDEVVAEDRAL